MKRPTIAWALALLLAVGLEARAQSPCGPSGLTLATTGGRLGDPFSLTLSGTPSVSGVLGFDLAPGPVATPIGSICLGLSPALQTLPFTLSPAGTFGIAGLVPPNPALAGLGVYAQAAAADATQPGGYARSNGVHPVLRPPRLYFIDAGSATGPGAGVAYDAITDSFGPVVPLPSSVAAAVAVPALGWVAMILGDGTLLAFDAATGAVTLNQPFTANPGALSGIAVAGTTLILTEQSTSIAATLRTVTLPSGAPGITTTIPTTGFVQFIVTTPGSANAYVVVTVPGYNVGSAVIPVPLSGAAPLPTIVPGAGFYLSAWLLHNGIIYCLLTAGYGPMALNAVDTSLNAAFFPNPVPLPIQGPTFGAPFLFNYGPGTLGPTLFIQNPAGPALLQLSPQTLSYFAPSIPLPPGILDMKLSNGGSEWLLYSCQNCFSGGCSGCPPPAQTLLSLNATTHLLSPVGPLPNSGFGVLNVLPSATLNKAFFTTNNGIVPIATDPAATMGPGSPLPFVSQTAPAILVID